MKKIILLGSPGSGKGTLSSVIKKAFPNIIHINTGDIFRENVKNNTELGKKAKEYIDSGRLVPDELVYEIVKDRLSRADVMNKDYILDGYPRNFSQAEYLTKIAYIDIVLHLDVNRDIITKRILGRFGCEECGEIYNKFSKQPKENKGENMWLCDKCGTVIEFKQRSDDTEKTLKTRLDVYEKNTKPLVEYYEKKKILKKFDVENPLTLTADDLKKILEL